ncbi:MAG: LysR family transcriptional regulator [Clostridia bacterium]|nr:LysR family transcriptional regulator [Clostridia bacterium]
MEIRNLITFVHVAELNSFTKAAHILDYSQSTVSFQIKQLETELDCLLFERINHTISLTEEGRKLLKYAQNITQLTDEFNQNRNAATSLNGFIHVVTPDSVCEDMMATNYADFHKHYPGIRLKFTTADTDDMFRMLNHNEADLMLTLDNHIYQNDYVIAKEEQVKMHFVTGVSSPYATEKELAIRDIAHEPFILTEKGMGYRRVFDKALAKQSLEIQPVLEIGRTDIITDVLSKGIGISFLPDFVTDKAIRDGRLVYLNVTDIKTDIWKQLIYHRNKWISQSMNALIEYIKKMEFKN